VKDGFFDPKATWADRAGTFLTINEEYSIHLSLVYESKEWTRIVDYQEAKQKAEMASSKALQDSLARREDIQDADAL